MTVVSKLSADRMPWLRYFGMASIGARALSGTLPRDWIVLICGIALSAACYVIADGDLLIKTVGLVVLWGFAAASCGFTATHPYMFFGFFYLLYSISGPVLVYFDLHPFGFWGGRDVSLLDFSYVLDLEWLGFIILLCIIGPRRSDLLVGAAGPDRDMIFAGASFVCVASWAILSLLLLEIYTSGYSTKGDINLYGSWMTRLGFAYNTSVVSSMVVLHRLIARGARNTALILLVVIALFALMSVFISGQRNFLFRFLLSATVLIHVTAWRIRWPMVLLAIPAGLMAIYWLGDQKMAWLSTAVEDVGDIVGTAIPFGLPERYLDLVGDPGWMQYLKAALVMGFGTELLTASSNLAIIVDRVPFDLPYLEGSTLLVNDIARAFLPGFLVGNDLPTTGTVYQETFFPEYFAVGEGPGFTLLGAGYMNFGVAGVALVTAILALMLKGVYWWAGRSAMGFLFFVGFLPIAIYATRMDLTSPISQGLKHVFLPLLAMAFLGMLRKRSSD